MDSAARTLAVVAITVALLAVFAASRAADRTERYHLSIDRGSLASGLEQFSRQTGLQIGTQLSVNESNTEEIGPLVGRMTADEAMRKLLQGTDLWYKWYDDSAIGVLRISEQMTNWSSGVVTAREASDYIRGRSGVHFETGPCGEYPVGPFESDERLSAEEFWIELIEPYCKIVRKRISNAEPGSIDRITATGEARHEFSIPEMPRALMIQRISEQAGGLQLAYLSSDTPEERALVGPIQGIMSVNEALEHVIRGSALRVRWAEDEIASIEPAFTLVPYADMSQCPHDCNFGFPELLPLESRSVTVEKSRLPSLDEQAASPVFVGVREWIASTGATSVPELFRYIPQFAFHRSSGYRLSGAQFFEGGRGFGPEYTLVLINGRRAFGAAADPMVSAFDLNSIPLPAVERLEISFDQPSVANGTDAIGGTVNIVLKAHTTGLVADGLLGASEGGATQRRSTLSSGYDAERLRGGVVLDYFSTAELLGEDRNRWSNQDFRRYGGTDHRSRFSAPPNVRAIEGNLPGLDSPTAAIVPGEHGVLVNTNAENLSSLRSWQAIVPASDRVSMYGFASADLGKELMLRGETLLGSRRTQYQLMPTMIPGMIWGADHPENPFEEDVLIEAALTGFPIQTFETDSDLARGVVELSGSLGDWNFSIFTLAQHDASRIRAHNAMDFSLIAQALSASDTGVLPVASANPGHGADPHGFMAPIKTDDLTTDARQFGMTLSGRVLELATGEMGVEQRRESIRFDPQVGVVSRTLDGAYAQVTLPLFQKKVEAMAGVRHDRYSDLANVTRAAYGLTWRPVSTLSIAASTSGLYRPPSLYELRRPRIATPTQIFDPARNELAPVIIVFGGNRALNATYGESSSLSLTWQADRWHAYANLWRIEVNDRTSAPSAPTLLATNGQLARDRVNRDPTSGRLSSIDVTYANFGSAFTRGLDLSVGREFETTAGLFDVRLDATHVFAMKYSDLPIANAPLLDRVGQAALEGTVPSNRAVLALTYSNALWRASLFARYRSSVDDHSVTTGIPLEGKISAQTLFDVNVSRRIGSSFELTIGADNLFDEQPPFAAGFGDVGFDQGMGDLLGRFGYLKVRASF